MITAWEYCQGIFEEGLNITTKYLSQTIDTGVPERASGRFTVFRCVITQHTDVTPVLSGCCLYKACSALQHELALRFRPWPCGCFVSPLMTFEPHEGYSYHKGTRQVCFLNLMRKFADDEP